MFFYHMINLYHLAPNVKFTLISQRASVLNSVLSTECYNYFTIHPHYTPLTHIKAMFYFWTSPERFSIHGVNNALFLTS